jgi:outer membrane lipoprotein SlyB
MSNPNPYDPAPRAAARTPAWMWITGAVVIAFVSAGIASAITARSVSNANTAAAPQQVATAAAPAPVAPAPEVQPAAQPATPAPVAAVEPEPAPAPVKAAAPAPARHVTRAPQHQAPVQVAQNGEPAAPPSYNPPPQPVVQAPPVCNYCGTVESVQAVKQQAEGSGGGAVAGGLLGGVVGHQMGNGRGRDAMTVIGAIGGALAGNAVEKNVRAETVYTLRVRMDDGSYRTVTQKTPIAAGARVTLDNLGAHPA